jgi:hypothetical protein
MKGNAVGTVGEGARATTTRANAAIGGMELSQEGAGTTTTRANAAIGGTSTAGGTTVATSVEGAGDTTTVANAATGGTNVTGGNATTLGTLEVQNSHRRK